MEPAKGSTLGIPQSPRLAGGIFWRASRVWTAMRGTMNTISTTRRTAVPWRPDYEKLGLFYLGKRYDLASNARLEDLILCDSGISSRTRSCSA